MPPLPDPASTHDRMTMVELVNRVVDRGVCLSGDITISVAEVDLLYLGVNLVLCAPDVLKQEGRPDPISPPRGPEEHA